MHTIIELLNDKNFCLEKFYRINEAELHNFKMGQFDNLERFYKNRDGLLNIVKKIDDLIEERSKDTAEEVSSNPEMKQTIYMALERKNSLVSQILEQDLQILSAIEVAKSKIIKELTQVKATKKALGSYKSGKAASRLDEEA